jgi:hypothetical protein
MSGFPSPIPVHVLSGFQQQARLDAAALCNVGAPGADAACQALYRMNGASAGVIVNITLVEISPEDRRAMRTPLPESAQRLRRFALTAPAGVDGTPDANGVDARNWIVHLQQGQFFDVAPLAVGVMGDGTVTLRVASRPHLAGGSVWNCEVTL